MKIMERPKTEREYVEMLRLAGSIEKSFAPDALNCASCGEPYSKNIAALTEGHCADCARELFYGNIAPAVDGVLSMNEEVAAHQSSANSSLADGQKAGLAKILSERN